MKKNSLLIIILLAVFSLTGQAQISAQKSENSKDPINNVTTKYDKFKDKTTVTLVLQLLGSAPPFEGLTLFLSSTFDGNQPKITPRTVGVAFTAVGKTKQYSLSHSLIVLADDERLRLGNGLYSGSEKDSKSLELILYMPETEAIKKIANAKQVEAQLGSTEFALNQNQLKLLKEFYSKITMQ